VTPALWIFALAVATRTAFLIAFQSYEYDSAFHHWAAGWETGRIAWYLSEGQGFSIDVPRLGPPSPAPTAWLAPVYPAFVGAVFAVLGAFSTASILVVLGTQILVSAATAAALVRLGALAGAPGAGLLAGIVFAVYPPAVSIPVHTIWGTTWFTFSCVLVMQMLLRLREHCTLGGGVRIGALLGFALLVEPTIALFCPCAALWLLWHRRGAAMRPVLAMAAVAALVIAPWLVRNWLVLGEPIFIKSNFGHDFFCGNSPEADGHWRGLAQMLPGNLDPAAAAALPQLSEVELNRTLGRAAWQWVAEHPDRFAELCLERARHFWLAPMLPAVDRLPAALAAPAEIALRGSHYALLILAVAGAIAGWARRTAVGLPLLFLLAYPLPYYLTLAGVARYQYVTLPSSIFLAMHVLAPALRRWLPDGMRPVPS
jgi:hypothetical protein